MPRMIVPPMPTAIVALPHSRDGPEAKRVVRRVDAAHRDDEDPQNGVLPASSKNALSTWNASIHWLKPTRGA